MSRLPSLDALHVFAVAARHLNFTSAAAELHRTQSAVSHRVKALEAELGVQLFTRSPRRLELTAAGSALAHHMNQSLGGIERIIAGFGRLAGTQRLRITALPSVASRWLTPRLPRFLDLYPEIEVQVIAESRLLDLRTESIDLAVRFGRGRYPRHVVSLLMRDRVLPVCSPQLIVERAPVTSIDELLALPLVHDSDAEQDESGSDWRSWLEQMGRRATAHLPGQRFSDADLSIEAAVRGIGVALGRFSLVADYLADGKLVSPLSLVTSTAYSYYLVALPESACLPRVARFSRWLRAEAAATMFTAPPLQPLPG
ncbi:MAG TPA: LysR substrate-binding domain-containing protein [Steroidobacteraceae bacterium]|nr:LysR substrate-binding domain-containing protein [Steroidobacteraceae bacterium]